MCEDSIDYFTEAEYLYERRKHNRTELNSLMISFDKVFINSCAANYAFIPKELWETGVSL